MTDLLDSLMHGVTPETSTALPDASLRVMAEWFFADCHARNLAERTVEFYRTKLTYLVDAAGERYPHEITLQHLRLITEHYRAQRGWSITSTNHFITAIKVFFSYLVDEEVLSVSPAAKLDHLKADTHLPDPLSQQDVAAILEACSDGFCGVRDRALLLVFLDTGLRLGEVKNLLPGDIDLALGQILVRKTKNRRERIVPFSGATRRVLIRYLTQREARAVDEALWITETGSEMTRWYLVKRLEGIAKRGGVKGFHLHRLRHTMATEFLRNGGNPAVLQRILGHSTGRMTERYVHLTNIDAKTSHETASPVERWRLDSGRRRRLR